MAVVAHAELDGERLAQREAIRDPDLGVAAALVAPVAVLLLARRRPRACELELGFDPVAVVEGSDVVPQLPAPAQELLRARRQAPGLRRGFDFGPAFVGDVEAAFVVRLGAVAVAGDPRPGEARFDQQRVAEDPLVPQPGVAIVIVVLQPLEAAILALFEVEVIRRRESPESQQLTLAQPELELAEEIPERRVLGADRPAGEVEEAAPPRGEPAAAIVRQRARSLHQRVDRAQAEERPPRRGGLDRREVERPSHAVAVARVEGAGRQAGAAEVFRRNGGERAVVVLEVKGVVELLAVQHDRDFVAAPAMDGEAGADVVRGDAGKKRQRPEEIAAQVRYAVHLGASDRDRSRRLGLEQGELARLDDDLVVDVGLRLQGDLQAGRLPRLHPHLLDVFFEETARSCLQGVGARREVGEEAPPSDGTGDLAPFGRGEGERGAANGTELAPALELDHDRAAPRRVGRRRRNDRHHDEDAARLFLRLQAVRREHLRREWRAASSRADLRGPSSRAGPPGW